MMSLVESSKSNLLCGSSSGVGCEETATLSSRKRPLCRKERIAAAQGKDSSAFKAATVTAAAAPMSLSELVLPELKRQRTIETKKVAFAEELVRKIPATDVDPIVDDEALKEELWYNRQDYAIFKNNVRRDVLHMAIMYHRDSLRQLDFSEHSVVGIEKYCCSPNGQETIRALREQLFQAILTQQTLQKTLGLNDPETIRLMSQVHTHDSSQRAIERAQAFSA